MIKKESLLSQLNEFFSMQLQTENTASLLRKNTAFMSVCYSTYWGLERMAVPYE